MRSAGRVAAAICLAAGLAATAAGEPARAYTKSSITIDARSGLVLQAHNADASHPPASLSKLMTLYLTFEAMSRGR
ncbi:MAG: D-alanyl-D-alanine carboxypeptidase, partial [Rhodospirillaceae bacterium]|nr:D-alanyl-D-alanine carboxypeptidase [Rhodospirillaceae bacterium]